MRITSKHPVFFFNNQMLHYFLTLKNAVVNIAGEFQ